MSKNSIRSVLGLRPGLNFGRGPIVSSMILRAASLSDHLSASKRFVKSEPLSARTRSTSCMKSRASIVDASDAALDTASAPVAAATAAAIASSDGRSVRKYTVGLGAPEPACDSTSLSNSVTWAGFIPSRSILTGARPVQRCISTSSAMAASRDAATFVSPRGPASPLRMVLIGTARTPNATIA